MLGVTAFDQTNLNTVLDGIEVAFKDFEKTEAQKDLERVKAGQETDFLRRIS
jgi:zinc protease